MAQPPSVRGVADIVALIDGLKNVAGRARLSWYLAFGGLFLDAYANAALSAGLGPMTDQMHLSSTQISVPSPSARSSRSSSTPSAAGQPAASAGYHRC